jgi:conjugal transfer pilus assembly protein TraV
MSRRSRITLMLGLLAATSGCATLGGNVSGDFACRAPSGSCAPMSAIDDRAVETLATSNDSLGAAVEQPHLIGSPRSGATPARTGERTLTIIFPAYVDAAGVLHDEARAHAVVARPGWTFASTAESTSSSSEFSRSSAPSSLREAIAGSSPPAIEGLESSPAQAPYSIAPPPAGAAAGYPSPQALEAARAGHRIARPGTAAPAAAPPAEAAEKRLPGGKAPPRKRGEPAEAMKRVRQMAKPGLDQAASQKGNEDIGAVFAPVQPGREQPE